MLNNMYYSTFPILKFYIFIFLYHRVQGVTINTPQGLIEGVIESISGYDVTKFLGIPYAKPPVGDLRFKPPEPADDVTFYDAKYSRPMCMQPKEFLKLLNLTTDRDIVWKISEDCLYANVYVPGIVTPGNGLTVMVFIHGGSWQWGSGTHYDARRLAAVGGVIVVTFNYRLGLFGFYPSGGVESTLGLADQIQALKWVKRNIRSYGGDPDKVTIFGESAGGASASLLTLAPPARGLFRKAIIQSGLYASAWAMMDGEEGERARLNKLQALNLRKPENCTKSLLECLKTLSGETLVEITKYVMESTKLCSWNPDIDNNIIMHDFATNNSLIHPGLEFIMGFNKDEGGGMIEYICASETGEGCNEREGVDFQTIRKWVAPEINLQKFESVGNQYMQWYGGPRLPGKISLKAAAALTTDWFERFAANKTAARMRDAGHKTYVYEFNAKAANGFSDIFIQVHWSDDAQHTDELPYVFGLPEHGNDKKVATTMVHLWTSFAKGEPLTNWPQYGEQAQYIYISRPNPSRPEVYDVRKPLVEHRKEKFWHSWFYGGQVPSAKLMNDIDNVTVISNSG